MKHILPFAFLLSLLLFSIPLHAQLEKVIVETYYISDRVDAAAFQPIYDANGDVIDSFNLKAASVTYRIYVDLKPGYKLKKIYGNANHVLKITSDSVFFNNISEGQSFGRDINKNKFNSNPTLALDTWLTLRNATTNRSGILKTEDADGSSIKKLLHNTGNAAGISLDSADGFVNKIAGSIELFSEGILDQAGKIDSTIFGSLQAGHQFISNSAYFQNNSGVMGTPDSNKVLVAQLTTRGKISFELNIEVVDTLKGNNSKSFNYVAKNPQGNELVSPYLTYPYIQLCGCKDPNYLEYNKNLVCGIDDSCKTRIVFGCMDPQACNYDPNANFNLSSLCCYPGLCKDRDINLVCPYLNQQRNRLTFNLYPNPAQDQLTFQISAGGSKETRYVIYDSFGRVVLEKNMGVFPGTFNEEIDVSNLSAGVYMFRLFKGEDISDNKMFMKK